MHTKRIHLPSVSVLAAVMLGACAERAAPTEDEPPTRSVLDRRTELALLPGEYPCVRAELSGVGPLVLIVDTGASTTIISESFARAHGLVLQSFEAGAGPVHGTEVPIRHVTHLTRIELGAAVVTNARLAVVDFSTFDWLAGVDGILGQDLLRTWFTVLDAPGGRLVLLPQTTVEKACAELFDGSVGAAMFEPSWELGVPLVKCRLGRAGDVDLVLDTGANFIALPPATIEALGLELLRKERVATLAGAEERSIYALPRTRLGALTIWGDVNAWERGVLGWNALKDLVIAEDGRSGRIYVLEAPRWK